MSSEPLSVDDMYHQVHKDMAALSVYESSSSVQVLIEKAVKYNRFFHPNLCHVCKKVKIDLKECPYCRMISYCSEDHMMLHRQQHASICDAIIHLSLSRNVKDFRGRTQEDWVKFKKDNIEQIKLLLKRKLEPYERQMFLFPKSCLICHSQENLSPPCLKCLSVNVCNEHNSPFLEHKCKQLKQCHILDTHDMWADNREQNIIQHTILTFHASSLTNIQTYINSYRKKTKGGICKSQCTLDDICLIDDLSGPMTLIFALEHMSQCLSQKEEFFIHIITDKLMDMRAVSAWELIYHQFYAKSSLIIGTIGPELVNDQYMVHPCATCVCDGDWSFYYYSICILYHEYEQYSSKESPNVIVVLNADFSNEEVSAQTIKAFQRQGCPVVLTAPSKIRVNHILKMIWKTLGKHINPIMCERNRFVSDRPCRDYVTDSVMLPNKYIILYQNLNDSNGPASINGNSSSAA